MADPIFGSATTDPFGLTDTGTYAVLTFADIDGDGDFDAFYGDTPGNTLLFRNTGSATGGGAGFFSVAAAGEFFRQGFLDHGWSGRLAIGKPSDYQRYLVKGE